MTVTFFKSSPELHRWLKANHSQYAELWIGFHKKASGKPSVTHTEALDEALSFGWIDGLRRSVTSDSYTIRFTPRRPKSKWSVVNLARVRKLAQEGRMQPSGLKACEGAEDTPRAYSYEQRNAARFTAREELRFRGCKKAWEFFQLQPPWYRRTTTWWVTSARKEETRNRRLTPLIEDSGAGRTIPPRTRKPVIPKRQRNH